VRSFHVNVVHESQHYLGNADLGLGETSAQALARAAGALRGPARHPVAFLERA
jgi:hypothetical protein